MSTQILTYLLVGSSFALYIGIAVWTKAASTRDFYIAGGGVNPLVNGMATAADWMSAASFIRGFTVSLPFYLVGLLRLLLTLKV